VGGVAEDWFGCAADSAELALSAWGRWDDEIPAPLLAELQLAYIRRKRFEAKLQAAELVQALAMALGGRPAAPSAVMWRGNSGKAYREIGAEAALALCC